MTSRLVARDILSNCGSLFKKATEIVQLYNNQGNPLFAGYEIAGYNLQLRDISLVCGVSQLWMYVAIARYPLQSRDIWFVSFVYHNVHLHNI